MLWSYRGYDQRQTPVTSRTRTVVPVGIYSIAARQSRYQRKCAPVTLHVVLQGDPASMGNRFTSTLERDLGNGEERRADAECEQGGVPVAIARWELPAELSPPRRRRALKMTIVARQPSNARALGRGGGQDLKVGTDPHGRVGQPGRLVGRRPGCSSPTGSSSESTMRGPDRLK
jgi:hypothetical protein